MISSDTYEELYEILKLMDKQSVMKVPIDILNIIKEQRNPEYKTRIDKNDIFNENNVKKETIDLLCYLDYHYWMDETKKAEVDKIRKQRFQEEETKKREQYNPNDIFKKTEKEEIELPIKGTTDNIEKILLKNGFEVFYKVLTITSYYIHNTELIQEHKILKEKCKRLRYVEPLSKFKNNWQNYKDWITKYNKSYCVKEENELLSKGYIKIYTDEKTDYVYKKMDEEKMYFQIQDIKGDCLMIAYDNEKYYNLRNDEQRKMLISDVKKYGIEIIDENNIDRFKLIGKTLSIDEIIKKMNEALNSLGINKISIIFYNSLLYSYLRKIKKAIKNK